MSQQPSQGSYQGPWPSQLPSGVFPGMPTVGIQRPLTVTIAFWLMLGAGLLLLASTPFLADWMQAYVRDTLAIAAVESSRPIPPGLAEQIGAMMVPFMWGSALISAGIYALLAFGLRAGRNWVRILVTVFSGLSVLSAGFGIAVLAVFGPALGTTLGAMYPGPAVAYVPSLLVSVLFVASTILMWMPPSNYYVAAQRAARLGGGYQR